MNKEQVFIDTGAWIACMSKRDKHHNEAIAYMLELRKKHIPLLTSNYVIDETLTWLNYNNLHGKALQVMKLWKEAERNQSLSICWVDKEISSEAWEIFRRFSEHRLSFTDCISFAICKERNIKKIFGFDKHFNILGFLLSPYQIHECGVEYDILKP